MFLIILLYALLALTFTISKFAVESANPIFFVGVRMIVAGIILLAFFGLEKIFMKRGLPARYSKKDLFLFFKVVLFHVYLAMVPLFWALQYITSVKSNILYTTTPFITVILSYFIYNEKVNKRQVLAIIIAFLGLVPLLLRDVPLSPRNLFSLSVPEFVLLISVISAAYAWFVIKKLMDRGYSLLIVNGFGMFIGGILIFLTWLLVYDMSASPIYAMKPFIYSLIGMVVVSNIIVYSLYSWLTKFYSLNLISVVGFLSPVFGAFYGYFFLGETIAWPHFLAIFCISISLFLFYKKGKDGARIGKA